jgi:hypothetical protein
MSFLVSKQLEQAVLTDQAFRASVVSQKAVDQFVRDGYLLAFPWECSSFLPIDRLHKSSYTPQRWEATKSFELHGLVFLSLFCDS